MKRFSYYVITGAISILTLSGCARTQHALINADAGYINTKSLPVGDGSVNPIRLAALRDGATSLGARGALAWRSTHIDDALESEASYLDHIFDFNQLLLKNNVLPPVLVESQQNLTLDGRNSLRTANKTYKIIAPARFVTAPPTWRTYLEMSFDKPGVPSKSLLPTTQAEAYIWNQFLKQGWRQGLQQANDIFSANLNRLKRDFLGMILYRKLLEQNMISSPVISKADLGVTGNKNEMRIDDAVMRITTDSALKLDSTRWKPVITR